MTEWKKKEKWFVAAKKADFKEIADKYGIDQVTARIIRNRDVIGEQEIFNYLYGTMEQMNPPGLLKGCREAAQLLKQKIEENQQIRIIGDYDIDGVNATYILYRGITLCGGKVDYEIPDRMKDGYGLNIHLIELALEEKVDTIITCDNGISAMEEISFAREHGLTVIVTDHHEPRFEDTEAGRSYILPEADVLVNPKQPGCPYPYKKLCGAAVAWKTMCLLFELCGVPFQRAEELLPFAAFATVGDVMDLDGENRILVKEGLKRLPYTDNPGLRALIQANGLDIQSVTAYHIGFVLGPCINASGRLDTAKLSMRLLLSENQKEAAELALRLKELNDERKLLTQEAVEEACSMIDEGACAGDRVLVVYLPQCHESIAGIVAGRLRERYYRPVFVVTDSEEMAKGSGRSIEAYSMFEEMVKCGDVFTKYGGHPMAAGFSLERSRIDEMRRRLNENCSLSEDDLMEKVSIDVPMPIDYITEKFVSELSLLEPFGKGNEKPLFAEAGIRLLNARVLGKNANVLKLRVMNRAGTVMDAMYFGDPEAVRSYLIQKYDAHRVQELFWGRGEGLTLDLTYYPSVNEYMGRRSLQIVIKNYR
ncbi:MAG: single-stranded-DNA-specific exonuclease RecJ [Lachnospiraceae bacterium]|nr:single-stranded-DNA-specific exonuclease RecJ [Lachnospiraceae bacterium]